MEGIGLARELADTAALSSVLVKELKPGLKMQTRSQLVDYARSTSAHVWHAVGTCKMGKDALAVVDAELRVHGVGGLRVIDASVMPAITSGNTNAPTIMIAERGADLIKGNAQPA
jgi:choline dehydrogenase